MAADDARVPRSQRSTPAVRSGVRVRPDTFTVDDSLPPTAKMESLRPPSTPELRIETITSRASSTPGTPTSIDVCSVRVAPSDEKIASHVQLLLEANRPVAAAEVMMVSRRYQEALELFLDNGVHHRVGACLRHLELPGEAIAHLMLTDPHGPHYREACREIARSAVELEGLDPMVLEYLESFSESGPRSETELTAFLDLAEIHQARGNARRARRCLQGVLRINPEHAAAQLMQLTWLANS